MVLYSALVQFFKDNKPKALLKGILGSVGLIIIGISASLYSYHSSPIEGEKSTVLVLQPNVDPYTEKYQLSNYKMAMDLVELASEKMDSTVVFVIAPETSLPKPRAIKEFKKTSEYAILSKFVAQYPQSAFVSGITFYERFSSQLAPGKKKNVLVGTTVTILHLFYNPTKNCKSITNPNWLWVWNIFHTEAFLAQY